ncbi:MAG TPA: SDR family oxidoreductase [Sphingobium sp.]|uniref:SDR family oxidoreductase n=1 Tax=Sphingobium sp. TaxID=1912891 RepID=UPI002ED3F839
MSILAGKTALVTGGSRGIGRQVALKLARDGAFVIVHYASNVQAAREVLAEIEGSGGAGCIVAADLGAADAVPILFAAIDTALAERDRTGIDILVNNAGIGMQGDVLTISPADYDRVFAINAKAPLFVAQAALERMGEGGRIINISSVVGRKAFGGGYVAYGATKAALDYMSISMAAALGSRGITVNSVAPGATATDFMGAALDNEEMMRGMGTIAALNAVGQPGDIAEVVAFLASPAARWVTGTRVEASGGTLL